MLTGSIATACFALTIALSLFLPIGMELARTDLSSPEAFGLAQHFLYLHGALWPLVLVSLIASIATANVLYRRMRAPLIRTPGVRTAQLSSRPNINLRIKPARTTGLAPPGPAIGVKSATSPARVRSTTKCSCGERSFASNAILSPGPHSRSSAF